MTIHKVTIALVCLLSVAVFTACGGATQSIDDPRAEDKEASKVLTPLIPNGTPKPEPPSPHAPTEASSPVPSPTSKPTPVPSNMGLQVQPASQPQDDEAEPENDGGNDKHNLENWRELYQIAYKTSCLDDRLGVAIVRKFQTGERGPTDAEFETIKTCEIERADLLADDNSRQESGDREEDQDKDEDENLQNWRELYQIAYTVSCMDDRLGVETIRKFQTGKRGPTSTELETIQSCEIERADLLPDDDPRQESGDGEEDQDNDEDENAVSRPKWNPSPDQIACYFSAIGKSSYRAIRAGDRLPTTGEINASLHCMDGTRTLNHVPHSLADEKCPPLEVWNKALMTDRPRWDQLECHMDGLQRLPIPSFRTSARVNPIVLWVPLGKPGCNGTMCPDGIVEVVYGLWDGDIDELLNSMEAPTWQLVIKGGPNRYLDIMRSLRFTEAEFPNANASFLPSGDVPPHIDELGETLATPLSDYWKDQRLRAYAVHAIQRKQEGHLTFFTSTEPPTTPPVPVSNPSDFRVWVDEVYIPRKIQEAKVVEKLKIEMWSPWAPEIDVFIMSQPWAEGLSDSELLDTGQYLLDAVADAVRPHFNGRIIPPSFTPGQLRHPMNPRAIWRELSFQGFEEVSFTFFPSCDEETTRKNLLHDMSVVMEIVERDGISWSLGDWWFVDTRPNECGNDVYDLADQITSSMLDILFDQPVPPVGGPVYGLGNIYSAEHKAVLEQGLFARSKGATSQRKDEGDDKDDMDVMSRIEVLKAVSGGWIRTGDPKKDQFVLGYMPTPDEWRCGVEAVGVKTLRNIRAGKHPITDEENQKLTPCFRASPDSLTHPLAQLWEGHCIPLDVLLEFVDYYRPSWEQLECHLEGLERYEMPKQVRYLQLSDPFGIRASKGALAPPLWDRIMVDPYYADLKLNFSPSMGNMSMPPSHDEEYNSINCLHSYRDASGKLVLDKYWIDESMRGAALAYIIEKKKGRRIYADTDMCSNAYIVQGNPDTYKMPPMTSVEDYKEWALNVVIPKYVIQAKAAEKVKAEMMQLGGIKAEVEVIFASDEFLANLPHSEQVELAQWLLDRLIPEVKTHFHGMIWVASAAHYDSGHPDFPGTGLRPSDGPHWKSLFFKAADHVSFTLSTGCDFAHLERYLDSQFDAIMEIVQRDNVTWGIIPDISKRKYGPAFLKDCKDDFDDRQVEMFELLYSKLDALPIQPYFLNIPPPPRSWTKDDEGYSPTATDAQKGDWQLFSLDVAELPEEVRNVSMEYARAHVRE